MKRNKKWSELTEAQKQGRRDANKRYYEAHREQCLSEHKARKIRIGSGWKSLQREYGRAANQKSYQKMHGEPERKSKHLERKRLWEKSNRVLNGERVREYMRTWAFKLKQEVMKAYGGHCSCCGEDRVEFLTMDHVNNDGAALRKAGEPMGGALYAMLKRLGFPSAYQPLCWNCNVAKHQYGECPHKTAIREALGIAA